MDISGEHSTMNLITMSSEDTTNVKLKFLPEHFTTNPEGNMYRVPDNSEDCKRPFLELSEICKQFGVGRDTKTVLSGVNLLIKPYQIFAIYGAKKCGKTTLMKIMLGLMAPTFGVVKYNVDCFKRKSGVPTIQYVPERNGLYMNCTVKENLRFFGKFLNFSKKKTEKLYNEIIRRMGITKSNLLLEDMDNDDIMRLSFFISSMSKPDILVVDEGTSNVDPIFKSEMWTQMLLIKRNFDTTIILTSSDTEECQKADMISYLKDGRILETGPPEQLLHRFRQSTMEAIFHYISRKLEEDDEQPFLVGSESGPFTVPTDEVITDEIVVTNDEKLNFNELFPCQSSSLTILLTLLYEKLLSSWHNRYFYLFVSVILPNLVLVAFYFGIGQDMDNATIGLRKCSACHENTTYNEMTVYCETYKAVMDEFRYKEYDSDKEMNDALYDGTLRGIISYNFTGISAKDLDFLERNCLNSTRHTGPLLPIKIVIDVSVRSLLFHMKSVMDFVIKKLDTKTPQFSMKSNFQSTKTQRKDSFFVVENAFHDVKDEADSIIWGITVMIVFNFGGLVGIWAVIVQRSCTLADRLRVLGLKMWHFESVRIFDIVLVFIGTALLFGVTQFLNSIRPQNPTWILVILYIFGLSSMTTGLLLATIVQNAFYINMIMMVVNFVALILSGALWPQDALESIPFVVSQLLPHTHVNNGIHEYAFRGLGLENFTVSKAIWMPIIWIFVTYFGYLVIIFQNWM